MSARHFNNTTGVLFFVQEITASHLAGVPSPRPTAKSGTTQYDLEAALSRAKITPRAFALAIYGAFISAPLNHVLVGRLQKMFAGKTTPKDRLLQLLTNSVCIAPITTVGMSTEVRARYDERSLTGGRSVPCEHGYHWGRSNC